MYVFSCKSTIHLKKLNFKYQNGNYFLDMPRSCSKVDRKLQKCLILDFFMLSQQVCRMVVQKRCLVTYSKQNSGYTVDPYHHLQRSSPIKISKSSTELVSKYIINVEKYFFFLINRMTSFHANRLFNKTK